jgi:hypothetical protein
LEKDDIFRKIDQIALETGERPLVFKNNGIPVFVKFPAEADKYFTPQEMKTAEQLLLGDKPEEVQKPTDLAQRLSQAREKADGINQSSPVKEIPRRDKEKQI